MSAKNSSSISKVCCFCNSSEDNEVEYGKIYEHNGIVTHYYCLLLSSNMEQKGNDDEGILGFLTDEIQKELRRGKRLVCSYCRKSGATLGCCNVKCKKIFHFPCGLKAGSLHQFFGEFRSYCINHRPKQIVDDQIVNQFRLVDNVLCYICYDKVNINDLIKTLWAPCCRKDAWFHRTCIQQLALSAGYFFKCPLCNNKKDFQKAMLEYGIFVPSQDASWELVPNAFEELLYRHDQCDASKCLCPKGRKHTSHNAKWELTLCRTCGSQGIHMACGQLKWGNPIWDCEECTSILRNKEHNKQVRLGNSSAIDGSSQNTNPDPNYSPDSQSELDSDTDSDSDSDTDISVGTDDFHLLKSKLANSSSTSTSSLDSISNVKLRPGPRFFKLRQQLNRLSKWMTNPELEVTEANLRINELLSNNDSERKDSSISKENISQQESKEVISQQDSKEDISQQESMENIFQKERQSFSRNDEKSQSIQKEDVVTIESDDDDVKFIALKEKTNVSLTQQSIQQSDSSHNPSVLTLTQTTKSLTTTENSTASKSKIITTIDLSENDNINVAKSTVSEASSKTESISNPVNVVTPQESTLDLIASDRSNKDLVEIDTTDTNEISVLNIKITNVTSLLPEEFEKEPDIHNYIGTDKNTTDASSLPTNNVVPQLVTHISSAKRSMQEASDITDNSKKIKRNTDRQFYRETSFISTNTSAVTHNMNNTNDTSNINNTNKQQNESTFANKSSKIDENDKHPSKCKSETVNDITIPMLSYEKNDLPIQSILVPKTNDMRHVSQIVSYLEGNSPNVAFNIQQSKENSVVYGNTEYVTVSKRKPVYVPINRIYLEQIPNPFEPINQHADKTNFYAIPSSGIILPHMTDNITVLNQTMVVNPPIMTSVTTPILNNNQIQAVNQQKSASRGNVPASMSSAGNSSSNNFYCDGDAGPANSADSSSRKKDVPTSDFHRNEHGKQASQKSRHSVFPQVTTNHNTCHQPRLIPRYMNLQDLKFQVCGSNNIQMTLYDTFSVNIPIKKFPKENESQSAGIAAPLRKSKESSILASREASCSSDHIDNIPTERQRCDKLFRSLKNEKCLINDKSTYVTRGQDDVKENLDPIKSRMLSRSGTDDVNSTSNVDDTVTMSFYGENETVSSDTDNLSTLSPPICNTNIMDMECYGITCVANSCNQDVQINLEDLQRKDCAHNATSISVEERPGARLFCKETNRLIHNIDFDLNVVNMNKNVEKVSQNDIIVPTSHDRISNDHTDDSSPSWKGYKVNNRNIARGVSNITKFNEHNILNKQIDTCGSRKFIRCIAFQDNVVRYNGDTRKKSNDFCLKVSIDLCKIQNLIDSKPELFKNREHDVNNQRLKRMNRIPNLDAYAQQVRYCDIEINNSCLPKSRELQKSNCMYNVEHMQREVYPNANTFLCSQKPNQRIRDFDKDILDR